MGSFITTLRKERYAVLMLVGVLAFFSAFTFSTPVYDVRQGAFDAEIEAIIAGSEMTGRPSVSAQVIDTEGRGFRIRLPASTPLVAGDTVRIGVSCTDDTYQKCTALHLPG